MLEDAGYRAADDEQVPDLIVFNTCAVRENADKPLLVRQPRASTAVEDRQPGPADRGRGAWRRRTGPRLWIAHHGSTSCSAPTTWVRCRHRWIAPGSATRRRSRFSNSSTSFHLQSLPTWRESAFNGWVAISVGCNNTFSSASCRRCAASEAGPLTEQILAEVEQLAAEGVVEITLLGQNVNAYRHGGHHGFADLLRACGEVAGLRRVRFTSPHPRDFTDDVIEAMAQTPNAMPQLHMPLQSGSDDVLRRMRRSYRAQRYLGILGRVREAMPAAAITTDIIVGFPGDRGRLPSHARVVEQSRFAGLHLPVLPAPGHTRSRVPDQVPHAVVQSATNALSSGSTRSHGSRTRIWSAARWRFWCQWGGRGDSATARRTGCAADGRLVHFLDKPLEPDRGTTSHRVPVTWSRPR